MIIVYAMIIYDVIFKKMESMLGEELVICI